MLRFLYSYITHPKSIIQTHSTHQLGLPSLLILSLVAASSLATTPTSSIWISFITQFLLVGSLLIIQSIITDFIAQLTGNPANSLKLFQLMTLSLLPFLAEPALNILVSIPVPLIQFLIKTLSFGLFIYSGYLQLISVKSLYQVSTAKALLIYTLPVILILATIAAIIIAMAFQVGFL
jgi:hypothetical protein